MPRPECPVCGQFHVGGTCAEELQAIVSGCPYNIRNSRTHRCSFCDERLADEDLVNLEAMWRLPAREPDR